MNGGSEWSPSATLQTGAVSIRRSIKTGLTPETILERPRPPPLPGLFRIAQSHADVLNTRLSSAASSARCDAVEFAQPGEEIVIQGREKAVLARGEQEPAAGALTPDLADVMQLPTGVENRRRSPVRCD